MGIKTTIKKQDLRFIISKLKKTHRVIGPKIDNNVIVLSEIDFDDLPQGYKDLQSAGSYRLNKINNSDIFSFSLGFDSFKRFLNPPYTEVATFKSSKKIFSMSPNLYNGNPFVFFGIRACDISALKLYDRVFLSNIIKDPYYTSLRNNVIIVAINCNEPTDNCFCTSTGTGPEVKEGYDLLITELEGSFLIESGSAIGNEIIKDILQDEVSDKDILEKKDRIKRCLKMFKKSIRFNELPTLVLQNLEHPRWHEIAERDLECGNCTQVCPTCFCSSTFDSIEIGGISKQFNEIQGSKIKVWDSCFSRNFARVHGGNFRISRRARYRQWFAHKLAYCIEQFGLPGCVGCGRCITWCPAGIDITQELEALRVAR